MQRKTSRRARKKADAACRPHKRAKAKTEDGPCWLDLLLPEDVLDAILVEWLFAWRPVTIYVCRRWARILREVPINRKPFFERTMESCPHTDPEFMTYIYRFGYLHRGSYIMPRLVGHVLFQAALAGALDLMCWIYSHHQTDRIHHVAPIQGLARKGHADVLDTLVKKTWMTPVLLLQDTDKGNWLRILRTSIHTALINDHISFVDKLFEFIPAYVFAQEMGSISARRRGPGTQGLPRCFDRKHHQTRLNDGLVGPNFIRKVSCKGTWKTVRTCIELYSGDRWFIQGRIAGAVLGAVESQNLVLVQRLDAKYEPSFTLDLLSTIWGATTDYARNRSGKVLDAALDVQRWILRHWGTKEYLDSSATCATPFYLLYQSMQIGSLQAVWECFYAFEPKIASGLFGPMDPLRRYQYCTEYGVLFKPGAMHRPSITITLDEVKGILQAVVHAPETIPFVVEPLKRVLALPQEVSDWLVSNFQSQSRQPWACRLRESCVV